MPTECSAEHFDFGTVEGRAVEAAFDGGLVSSDAGALLLGATDRAIGLIDRFAACFRDERREDLIEHEVATLVGQRVFGIALGYEDLNDHDELRHDPLMAVLAGKLAARREDCAPVAGKSTLNRLELSKLEPTRYHKISHNPVAIKNLLVDLFVEAHARPPKQIILDLDATDDPLHGEQEGRFFHGYYDCYCYLPLYVFCGRHLLVAKLRSADMDAAAGAVEEVARVIARIRARWPRTRILLRADSGFAREDLMAWCEGNGVDFLFGLARNARLVAEIATELDLVAAKSRRSGRPERRFKTFMWTTRRTWSRRRRVVAKAEWTKGEANPRFVVTSLRRDECKAKYLYEKVYCARGEMENRIKECQLDLYADRTSAATMRANQLRLWFYSMAYVLLCALRARYRLRQRHLRHHPSQAAQDRSARARQRPPHQDRHGIGLSGRARLGTRRNPARNRRHRPRLPGMTHAAPARSLRGTTHRPTETQKIADMDSALRRHEHPRRRTSSRQNRLTPCPIHQ
jgi:Transposase DDE domain group 1